jgi:hypothetical protein
MQRSALVRIAFITSTLAVASGCGGGDPSAGGVDGSEATASSAEIHRSNANGLTSAKKSVKTSAVQRGSANGADDVNDAAALASASMPTGQHRGAVMRGGDVLYGSANQYLSPDLNYPPLEMMWFMIQYDCNLVVYQKREGPPGEALPYWDAATWGRGSNCHLTMQTDGNLVIYNGSTYIWDSGTWGNPGAYVEAQYDGNVVIYRPDRTPIWWTSTVFRGGDGGGGGGGGGDHAGCEFVGTEATCHTALMFCEDIWFCNGVQERDSYYCGFCTPEGAPLHRTGAPHAAAGAQ